MRSKYLLCAAIAVTGVCTWFSSPARAADSKARAADSRAAEAKEKAAEKKKAAELDADERRIKKQFQWEEKVMGPDDKRATLDKIARAHAINEKAEKERAARDAREAAAPKPQAVAPAKKNEVSLPSVPDAKPVKAEIAPKVEAFAPPPVTKPADDKFIDKLLKEEQSANRKKTTANAKGGASDKELEHLLAGVKEKPTGRRGKGDMVDDLIKSADKGPAMPAPRAAAALPDWTKTPDIAPTPPPPPAPVAVKPQPKNDGVIHVVQGSASAPSERPAPVATATRAPAPTARKAAPAKSTVTWQDPFADKKTVASRDRESFTPAAAQKRESAARPATTGGAWSDPFAEPERKATRRAAPTTTSSSPSAAPPSAPRRGEKSGEPAAHPAGWKDPFTKAPVEPARTPVAMRELGKGESSKWEIATHHGGSRAAASDAHSGWGVIKKRAR
jgi:hypothetical protein